MIPAEYLKEKGESFIRVFLRKHGKFLRSDGIARFKRFYEKIVRFGNIYRERLEKSRLGLYKRSKQPSGGDEYEIET